MARSDLAASIIETSFMQVRDGYVFRYSPWAPFGVALTGPSQYFRLDESQKAKIVGELLFTYEKMKDRGPLLGGVAIVIFLAGAIWLAANDYSRGLLAPLILLAMTPMYLYFRLCYVRTLRPLLDGLPRARARIAFRKRLQKFSANAPLSFPLIRLIFCTGLSVLSLIGLIRTASAAGWTANLVAMVMLTVAFAVLTIYYSYLIVLRAT